MCGYGLFTYNFLFQLYGNKAFYLLGKLPITYVVSTPNIDLRNSADRRKVLSKCR